MHWQHNVTRQKSNCFVIDGLVRKCDPAVEIQTELDFLLFLKLTSVLETCFASVSVA